MVIDALLRERAASEPHIDADVLERKNTGDEPRLVLNGCSGRRADTRQMPRSCVRNPNRPSVQRGQGRALIGLDPTAAAAGGVSSGTRRAASSLRVQRQRSDHRLKIHSLPGET